MASDNLVSITKSYYDSQDADEFYHQIWGGEDIHIGLYTGKDEAISTASQRTVRQMAERLHNLGPKTGLLDIGAGYGGAARFLAQEFHCPVTCLNLSEKENERNRQKNREVGLDERIDVHGGNFEALPFPDEQFHIVWCQDAILHSDRKAKVFEEVYRVLKTGGEFIFTDPMQNDHCPDGVLDPILRRIHLKEMGSVKMYKEFADRLGFQIVHIEEIPEQLVNHYRRVREELVNHKNKLREVCSEDYIERMYAGLGHWVEGGKNGYLNWGILHFRKA